MMLTQEKRLMISQKKTFDKIQHTFMIKTQQTRNGRKIHQLDKGHLRKMSLIKKKTSKKARMPVLTISVQHL